MRKAFLLILAICLVLPVATFAQKQTEIIVMSNYSDQAPKDTMAAVAAEFMRLNPTIKVTINTVAHEQFKTQLVNYLTAKNPPDLLTWFAGYRMQQHAVKGLLEPLDTAFPGGKMEKEFPAAFKDACSFKGKVYMMPNSWYWWAVYYNKDVFASLGLKPPKTWDEFLAVCEALKKGGVAPIAIGAKDTWTAGGWFDYMDVAVNGGDFHKQLTAGTVAYTDPKVLKTFGYLADLSKKGYIMPNATSYSWQEAANVLFDGKAGMYLMGQFVKDVAPADKKDSIDFFKFPLVGANTKYGVDTPLDGFMMPKNSKNKVAAKKFLLFMATKEGQELFAKPLGRLAANINVPVPNADAQRGLDMVKGATWAMLFYDRDAPEEMAAKGMNAIVDILQTPDNMNAILAALDKERVRIYEELK
ncbi:MAG: sugar ABC transporter substrate-binding protein [Spirochaetes bacterium]|nr:sugar ABC transporter substrate-binding protein [Spirochaetota bacterium]